MRVTIYGPNLPRPLCDKGTLHVHRANCADLGKYARLGLDPPWTIDADTVASVVFDIYPPSNFDYDPGDLGDYRAYRSDIYFFPCTDDLPEGN